MGSEKFTAGRLVPFLMAGPAIVWTTSNFSNFGGGSKTATDLGVVAEVGLEFFMWPHLSIGPSFRYRHVFGPKPTQPPRLSMLLLSWTNSWSWVVWLTTSNRRLFTIKKTIISLMCLLMAVVWAAGCTCPGPRPPVPAPVVVAPPPVRQPEEPKCAPCAPGACAFEEAEGTRHLLGPPAVFWRRNPG